MVYRRTGEAGEKGSKTRLNCTIPSCGEVCIRVLEGTMACHTSCFYFFGCPKLERQRASGTRNADRLSVMRRKTCTVVEKMLLEDGGGAQNVNRSSENRETQDVTKVIGSLSFFVTENATLAPKGVAPSSGGHAGQTRT